MARTGLLALVVLIFFSSGTLQAQLSTASLSGTVVDPSSAGIPSATITLESTLQKYAREAVTGSEGSYVMPAIPPGKYKLTVRARGFQPEALAEFSLSSGQATTIDVAMHLAKAGESITVIAAPALLQTTTATVGQAIDRTEITELPISQRNVTNLTLLVPGVGARNAPDGGTPQTMYAGGSNPSFYGQRQRSNNWTLDGVPVNEPMQNGVVLMPPVDAVSEMKIESGMASGAYGHAAGANVNVVSRSGGNAYHGDGWEYLQNSSLDARSFFTPFIAKYRRNTFGAAVGGPLLIPGLLSKQKAWYFYGYYEGLTLRQSGQTSSLFPTTDQLNGNFAAGQSIYQNPKVTPIIYNPYSTVSGPDGTSMRQPFPNNQIPATLLNASSETLAKLFYAKPNIPYGQVAGANFFTTGPVITDGNQWSSRVDHQFGSKHGFFARYSEFRNIDSNAVRPDLPSNQYRRNTQAVLSDTITLSPTFVVTGRFGLTRLMWDSLGAANFTIAKAASTLDTWPKMQGLEIIPRSRSPATQAWPKAIPFMDPSCSSPGSLTRRN